MVRVKRLVLFSGYRNKIKSGKNPNRFLDANDHFDVSY